VDGSFLPGEVEVRPGGVLRLKQDGGGAREIDPDGVAMAQQSGKVVYLPEEFPVYRVWRGALNASFLDSLEESFEAYARAGLLADCSRLLTEAREYDIDARRIEEMQQLLTGRTARSSRQGRKNLMRLENAWREEEWSSFIEAVDWCEERELVYAASALLFDADRVLPGRAEVDGKAEALMPESFPWRDDADAARRWIRWAHGLLPAGAEFLSPEDAVWGRLKTSPWTRDTCGFRTENLLVFSREHDLEAVTGCLRNGEGSVRCLESLLKGGRVAKVGNDRERLEVRIHRNEAEYASEEVENPESSLGNYSPRERISRFFVPTSDSERLLGRALFEVLSHELTHQYIEERWVTGDLGSNVLTPGYWVVEGMARFVEDQALEMGRRGIRFDDDTVVSLDAAAQAEKKGLLLDFAKFLNLSQADFYRLDTEPRYSVTLRNTLHSFGLSEMNIFYEQAGSLVFYLVNRAGGKRRKAFVRYLVGYYNGRAGREGWKALGYESPGELEREYRKFLRGLLE
jgi:hypothetical protein